ncbi:hypothetical protein DFQ28_007685 [Apophysomyces sp. BC1034]|nr:hypothetical protein DFQ29_001162 [Apophysomyces sp. BC1021]KAG0192781.1 hypothetical protein DFQ28_007685 [Apophysomyces sp. BC1034]
MTRFERLCRKGITSAAIITEHSFVPLVFSALEQINNRSSCGENDEASDKQDDYFESFWESIPANATDDFTTGPASQLNHTPEKPKLTTSQTQQIRSRYQLALSGTPLLLMSAPLQAIRNKHNKDQYSLATLKSFTNAYQGLIELMQENVQ